LDKTRNNKILLRSCLCGFILTVLVSVNLLVAIPSEFMKSPYLIFATSDNEDNNVEPVGTDEQQEQGTIDNSDETDDSDSTDDGSGVASEQDNACPAVAFEGPSYIGENGCPVPCPKDGQDSVPEGCPPPQPQQPVEQSTTPPTLTDDIAGTIQQEEGAAGLEPDESITLASPDQIPSALKPLNTTMITITNEEGLCDDQIDNDGDGKTDLQDFDCHRGFGLGGPFPPEICDDGKDNDRDGAIDTNDRDCPPPSQEAKPLTDMTSLAYETVCDDQVDNDRDGRTDQQDSDCHPGLGIPGSSIKPEICDDGKDNDRDGAIDAIDRDCLETKKPPGFDLGMLATTNPPPSGIQTPPESDPSAEPPISPTEQGLCSDGIDNDKDGLIDTQDTSDCPPLSESRPSGFSPFGP
jgi:hypothetical protein